MIQTSDAYKEMMKKPIRNRGYISVSLGVVNQNAQGNAKLDENTTKEYYSKGNLFNDTDNGITYGTLEQNFTKADGSFRFPPRNTQTIDLQNNGIVVPHGGSLIIKFDTDYDIKGLTIDFVETSYPTNFTIVTDEETVSISDNDTANFTTEAVLGSTSTITITPIAMLGGVQCMHIKRVVMGVGLTFQNSTVESAEFESFISGISIETSYKEIDVSAFDNNAQFDVDNESAFINYLQVGQPLSMSFGVDLDDGTQEWFQVANCRLKEWSARKGRVSFRATDLLAQLEETYSHMVIESRTAKSEFEAIFASMGLLPDDYHIDDYFASVNITNPIEENTYRDCLQLLANATRGVVFEDENGIVHVEKNFDRQAQGKSAILYYSEFSTQTDSFGNTIHVSDTSAYDGSFRVVNTENLFDNEDPLNSLEILNIEPYTQYFPETSVENNMFVYSFEEGQTRASGDITFKLTCSQKGRAFPIKEDGWYYIAYDQISTMYTKTNASVKIGNHSLTINSDTNKSFCFFVEKEDLGQGDLEIITQMSVAPIATLSTVRGIAIRKGQFDLSKHGYQSLYIARFRNPQNPYVNFSARVFATYKSLLVQFAKPHPTVVHIKLERDGEEFPVYEEDINVNSEMLLLPFGDTFQDGRITITKAVPNNPVIVKNVITLQRDDYVLPYFNMKELPFATMNEKVKALRVKIFSYEIEDGEIRRVDDEVYYTETLDSTGVVKTVENPLISSSVQAELVAKWMKAYYVRNITYDVEYRGEPALQANDMIYMENDYTMINPVDAEKVKLDFNGAFSGTIEARKALIVEN